MELVTILIGAVIALGLCVLVHEWGHYITAKKAGLKVQEFGFGFPPRIWGYKPKDSETTYSINWIPFGGFVSILGEDGSAKDDPRSFAAAKEGTRAWILVAGVIMNVVLALLLLIGVNFIGTRTVIGGDAVLAVQATDIVTTSVVHLTPGSPAQEAGLEIFDEVISLHHGDDIVAVFGVEEMKSFGEKYQGQEITVTVLRNDEVLEFALTPRIDPPEDEGRMGVAIAPTGFIRYSLFESIARGVEDTARFLWLFVKGFGLLVYDTIAGERELVKQVAGPLGIAEFSGQSLRQGPGQFMFFMAVISLNLAILNILPIPPLDGGKLFFTIIEKVRGGNPAPIWVQNLVGNVGFLFLIGLMIVATSQDIIRIF